MSLETFVTLGRADRWPVLFYFTRETWPYIALLWMKDLGLALLAGSLFFALARGTVRLERNPPGRATGFIVAVALLASAIGVALRFVWPEFIPPGLWFDVPFGGRAVLLRPEGLPWIGGVSFYDLPGVAGSHELVSYAYLHLYDAVFHIFGRTEAGFGAVSAVPGALAIPAATWLAWEVWGGLSASFATILIALSLWPLVFSRWGFTGSALIPLALLAAAATLAALRTHRRSLAVLAGACVGLSLHTHSSSWAVAAGLGVFSLILFRGKEARGLVLAGWLAAGLAFLPYGIGFLRNPANIGGRIRDVPLGSHVSGSYGAPFKGPLAAPATLFLNALDYTGVLLWTTDPNPRDGIPGRPPLGPLIGVVALIGFAGATRRRARGDLALLSLAAGSLCAGVLANPGGAPNTLRTCVFVPVALLMAAGVFGTWAVALSRARVARSGALAAGLATLLLVFESSPFLLAWPEDPSVRASFCTTETSVARLARNLGPNDLVLDPTALRFAFVFDALHEAKSARSPTTLAERKSVAELCASPPRRPFFFVARRSSLELLTRAGFHVGRGIAPNGDEPNVVLARVVPGRRL